MSGRKTQAKSSSIDLKIPLPHDPEVEQGLLGALIVKPERLDDVLPLISAEDFYLPAHQIIFKCICRLVAELGQLDLVSLASALRDSGELDGVGGTPALAGLADGVVLPSQAGYMAGVVRDMSRRRQAMRVAIEVYQAAADRTVGIDEVAVSTSGLVDRVLADKLDTGRQTPVQVVRDFEEWLDSATDSGQGVPLPFPRLQNMTGGFLPGEMIVLAARPSNGKTALALNMSLYALSQGKRVGIVSLEMRSRALMSRLSAMARSIDAQRFRNRTLTVEDRRSIAEFCARFKAAPVRMWDEPEFSPGRMRAVVRSWKRQLGGLDLLVVDYLQLMGSDQVDGRMSYNREQEVARISKAIKRLALGEEVPVMVLAQLNRQAEKDAKPMLSHLRESGSLEQDADFVLFLSFWDPRVAGNEVDVDLDVAKGRSSQTGTVPLSYVRPFLRFQDRRVV